jgi:hypothetical protein
MSEQPQDGPKLTREQKANLQRHLRNQTAQRGGSARKRGNKTSKWPWILGGALAFIAIYVGFALWVSRDDKVSFKTALVVPLFLLVFLAARSLWRALIARSRGS